MMQWLISLAIAIVGEEQYQFSFFHDSTCSAICAGLAVFGFHGRVSSMLSFSNKHPHLSKQLELI
jgi:hypothetical protein